MLGDQKSLDAFSHFCVQTRQTSARRRLVYAEHRARFAQTQIIEVVEFDQETIFSIESSERVSKSMFESRSRFALRKRALRVGRTGDGKVARFFMRLARESVKIRCLFCLYEPRCRAMAVNGKLADNRA
jgi:hypothetical protein